MVIVLFTYQMHQAVPTKIGTGTQAREFNNFRFVCRDTETIYLRDVQKYKNILKNNITLKFPIYVPKVLRELIITKGSNKNLDYIDITSILKQ